MIGGEAKVYFLNYFNALITTPPQVPEAEIIHTVAEKPDPRKVSWHNIRINRGSNLTLLTIYYMAPGKV